MKDTFLTQSYKGGYIHTHYDNGREVVEAQIFGNVRPVKSVQAAKRHIAHMVRYDAAIKTVPALMRPLR